MDVYSMNAMKLLFGLLVLFGMGFAVWNGVAGCMAINAPGDYALANNLSGANITAYSGLACVYINTSNVNFTCDSQFLGLFKYNITNNGTGGTTYGVAVAPVANNVNVTDCQIRNYSYAIYGDQVSNSNFLDNNMSNQLTYDMWVRDLSFSNVKRNNGTVGFEFSASALPSPIFNNFTDNNITDDGSDWTPCKGFYMAPKITGVPGFNLVENNYVSDADNFESYHLGSDNNTIINNTAIAGGRNGLFIEGDFNNITENLALGHNESGFFVKGSNNTLINNTAAYNDVITLFTLGPGSLVGGGFEIGGSHNLLMNNTAENNSNGYYIEADWTAMAFNYAFKNYLGLNVLGENNAIVLNTFEENSLFDLMVGGDLLIALPPTIPPPWICNNHIVGNNGSGGRPIYFNNTTANLQDMTYAEVLLCNASGSTLDNVTVDGSNTYNNNGVILFYSNDTTVTNSVADDNLFGYFVIRSENLTMDNVNATENLVGFTIVGSDNSTFNDIEAANNEVNISQIYRALIAPIEGVFTPLPPGTFDNLTKGVGFGAVIFNSDNATILDSDFYGNTGGALFINSDDQNVTGGSAHHNVLFGYLVVMSDGIHYEDLEVYNNDFTLGMTGTIGPLNLSKLDDLPLGFGMIVYDSKTTSTIRNTIENVEFYENAGALMLISTEKTRVRDGSAHDNLLYGYALASSKGTQLSNLQSYDNNGYLKLGLIDDLVPPIAPYLDIVEAVPMGAGVIDMHFATIQGNPPPAPASNQYSNVDIYGNSYGMIVFESNQNEMRNVNIHNNGVLGYFEITNEWHSDIRECTFSKNGDEVPETVFAIADAVINLIGPTPPTWPNIDDGLLRTEYAQASWLLYEINPGSPPPSSLLNRTRIGEGPSSWLISMYDEFNSTNLVTDTTIPVFSQLSYNVPYEYDPVGGWNYTKVTFKNNVTKPENLTAVNNKYLLMLMLDEIHGPGWFGDENIEGFAVHIPNTEIPYGLYKADTVELYTYSVNMSNVDIEMDDPVHPTDINITYNGEWESVPGQVFNQEDNITVVDMAAVNKGIGGPGIGFHGYVVFYGLFAEPIPQDDDDGGEPDVIEISVDSTCDGVLVTVEENGDPLPSAAVAMRDTYMSTLDTGTTDIDGQVELGFECGMQVQIEADGEITPWISLIDCDDCVCECVSDDDCLEEEYCDGCMCVQEEPECETDEDCQEGYYCDETGTCVEEEEEPECTTDGDCDLTQYCDIPQGETGGTCEDVTGECGYVEEHQWVQYECGDEPDCPECPEGYVCQDNVCIETGLECPVSMFIDEEDACEAVVDSTPCAYCDYVITDPTGMAYSGRTDADGQIVLAGLKVEGEYQVALVQYGKVLSEVTVDVLPKAPPTEAEKPTEQVGEDLSWLWVLLLVVVIIVAVALGRRRKKTRA